VATHDVPEQAKAVAPVVGQTAQDPPQASDPVAQAVATQLVPEHAVAVAPVGQTAQLPPHDSVPVLHVIPHVVPLQVAVAFGGIGQAVHDVPQLAGLVFEAQLPEQRWYPDEQVVATHEVPEQANAVAPVVGQVAQAVPQPSRPELLATHVPPQRLKPVLHRQACVEMSHVSLAVHCASSAQPGLHCPLARSQ
jgi:hypothetical protein